VKESNTSYDSVAWGRELSDDRPPGWVGDVDSHRIAYPARVERAKEFFPQAPFADFEVQKTGLDRYRLIDKATGTAYRVVGYDPLLSEQPRNCAVSVFTVDAGGSLLYLRREDTPEQSVEALLTDWATARKEAS
jgi:hypothetical protein